MAPLPFNADWTSASKPLLMRGPQAAASPTLGAPAAPGVWQAGALGLEHFLAALEGAVGIADLDGADLADALGDAAIEVLRGHAAQRVAFGLAAAGGLVVGDDIGDQADDGEHRNDKREKHREQQLLGRLDRAGVGFFLHAVAHGVLEFVRALKSTFDYSWGPRSNP